MVRIASALAGRGLPSGIILQALRPNYAEDVSDEEIAGVVRWAERHCSPHRGNPGMRFPVGLSHRNRTRREFSLRDRELPAATLRRFREPVSEADLWEASPVPLLEDWREDLPLFLEALYLPEDRINIVSTYSQRNGKASPMGYGKTLSREEWVSDFRKNGVPQGEAGAWIRMNPVDGTGISDANVVSHRFLLLECDGEDIERQRALFARLPLPVAAIVTSGGKSLHAWVRVDSPDPEEYRKTAEDVFERLIPLGVDPANRNPSRLARLPGAQRVLGRLGDGRQRLLYLAPNSSDLQPIFSR
jgi:hypothetical protein